MRHCIVQLGAQTGLRTRHVPRSPLASRYKVTASGRKQTYHRSLG